MAILPGMGPRNQLRTGDGQLATRAGDRSVRFRMRGALKYTFLPEFGPRIKRLGKSLGHFAYMLALVFRSARLLPANHPMLVSANIGRFGVLDVISTAANNLVISKKNIDQILIFGAIIMAVVMIVIQIAIIGVYAAMAPSMATAQDGMFTTPNPENDVVLTFLQQTIGLDGFFNNKSPIGFSIAAGLRAMLGFYSTGLMLIATCIVVYYVVTVVGESAQSGTPFGRRFNGLWAPVRLVLALGLLVPLGNGLNGAQYVALSVAKAGSGFATQAWNKFTNTTIDTKNIMAQVLPPGFTDVAKAIFMNEVCAAAYNRQQTSDDKKIIVKPQRPAQTTWGGDFNCTAGPEGGPCTVNPITTSRFVTYSWEQKTDWASNSGQQFFSCGAIKMSIIGGINDEDVAGRKVQEASLNAYGEAINKTIEMLRKPAEEYAKRLIPSAGSPGYNETAALPDAKVLQDAIKAADKIVLDSILGRQEGYQQAVVSQVMGGSDWKNGGWGNAATFYMRIAYANSIISEIIQNAPKPDSVATPDTALSAIIAGEADDRNFLRRNLPYLLGGRDAKPESTLGQQSKYILAAMKAASSRVDAWVASSTVSTATTPGSKNINKLVISDSSDSKFMAAINSFFAITSLSSLADSSQQHIFPMIKLSNIGRDLLSKVLSVFAAGFAASLVSTAVGNMIFFIGLIGLGIGFLLYYVLPFMPFIYFFFAIVEWGMGVLESMLGAPLWALAHLRIEGDGMPGQAAMQGYNILLGILLRPFFILFGLLASYVCFNSAANFLNQIFWGVIAARHGGPDGTASILGMSFNIGALGFIGYLIVYAIMIYNLGLVCFKMIDQIPNQALRWMSIQDATYKDGKPDPVGQISGSAMTAGTIVSGQVAGQAAQVGGATGSFLRGVGGKGKDAGAGAAKGKGKAKGS